MKNWRIGVSITTALAVAETWVFWGIYVILSGSWGMWYTRQDGIAVDYGVAFGIAASGTVLLTMVLGLMLSLGDDTDSKEE